MSKSPVVIVGAGVVGLSVGLVLSEKGYKVKFVAANFPTDPLTPEYTSSWAGAHFRPFPSKNEKDFEESRLTRATAKFFENLAVESPESSIKLVEGIDYLEEKGLYGTKSKGYYEDIKGLQEIPKSELPSGVEFGAKYRTWVLNAPLYLQFLQRKLTFEYGVEFHKIRLHSLKEVSQLYPGHTIINASGLGLQYNGGYDPKCYKIRGQTLLVRAPKGNPYEGKTVTHQGKDGSWTFVIQRPLNGGFILGGTKQINDFSSLPKDEDTKAIITRGKTLYPELFIDGELDIRNVNVGFRPAREGGSRVELDKSVTEESIIHAYGAAGMGFELSYGIALKVFEILESSTRVKSKL